ncbi:MAG: hypothetical protein N2037_07780 [Acidimicrobiales bacterium]|nr:hypothetical protein [Acidimicrobiales bacterium]
MSVHRRWGLTVMYSVLALISFGGVVADGGDPSWRLLSAIAFVLALWSIRIIHGRAIIVSDRYLRLQDRWPLKRDIPWYRILEVDVVPGLWTLEIELNSGLRIQLPCVEGFDDLYERIEQHRHEIGS